MSDDARGARKVRRRILRRWSATSLAVLALVASLVAVVQRGEEGRRLTATLGSLEAELRIVEDRIERARARVDSLTTSARIEGAAGALGLQQAEEEQLLQVDAANSGDEEGGER